MMINADLTAKIIDTAWFALQLFTELAILFVLISALLGLLQEWLPAEKTRHYLSARHGRGYVIGAFIGSITPFCSCSTVPLTLGLLKSGAGFGPTMALLFTSPLVNPIIIALFWITFGFELTILYTVTAIFLAILIAWGLQHFGFSQYLKKDIFAEALLTLDGTSKQDSEQETRVKDAAPSCCSGVGGAEESVVKPVAMNNPKADVVCCADGSSGAAVSLAQPLEGRGLAQVTEKFKKLVIEAINQFRSFLPHVIIGVLIGAVAHGFVPDAWLLEHAGPENFWAIPLAAIVGVPLYVRGSTMIPIAMTLTAKGMGIGAVIALVVGGAGASLPEVIMLKRMFHWPILLAFVLSVFTIAISTGLLAQMYFSV